MRLLLLLILFTETVWGTIPETEIQKAISHTAFIFVTNSYRSLVCHGTFFPHSGVILTAGHCLDHDVKYFIDRLRVVTFEPISPVNQNISIMTIGIRTLLGCLMEEHGPSSCAYSLDHDTIPITNENGTPIGFANIHRANEIYIHPNFKRDGLKDIHSAVKAIEDSAVIVLKDSISFSDQSAHTVAISKNQFNNQTGNCFTMDWRKPQSIFQPVQPVSRELFSYRMAQPLIPSDDRISFLMSNTSDSSDIFDRLYPVSLTQSLGLSREQLKRWYNTFSAPEKQIEAEKLFGEWYNGLSTNDYFTLKYIEDPVWEGHSGSPLWCYTPEAGVFLKGHTAGKMIDTGVFFIRNFDRDLHTWVENLK